LWYCSTANSSLLQLADWPRISNADILVYDALSYYWCLRP
jgi:hypothetical protein